MLYLTNNDMSEMSTQNLLLQSMELDGQNIDAIAGIGFCFPANNRHAKSCQSIMSTLVILF